MAHKDAGVNDVYTDAFTYSFIVVIVCMPLVVMRDASETLGRGVLVDHQISGVSGDPFILLGIRDLP